MAGIQRKIDSDVPGRISAYLCVRTHRQAKAGAPGRIGTTNRGCPTIPAFQDSLLANLAKKYGHARQSDISILA